MPYVFKEPEKTSSIAVLAYIRDRAELGHCVSVYHLNDFLEKVPYETPRHRMNDASVRLRTLEKSGYLRKVGKDYVQGDLSAASAAKEIQAHPGPGRPPAIYAITEQGVKYAATIADVYLDKSGKETPRDAMIRIVKTAYRSQETSVFVIRAESFRLLVEAPDADLATQTTQTWGKKAGYSLKSLLVEMLPKEKE